jgi:hypothetical protein
MRRRATRSRQEIRRETAGRARLRTALKGGVSALENQ